MLLQNGGRGFTSINSETRQQGPSTQAKSPDYGQGDVGSTYENFPEEMIHSPYGNPPSETGIELAVGNHKDGLRLTRELLTKNTNVKVTSGIVQCVSENTGCGRDVMQLLLDSRITTITDRAARFIALGFEQKVVQQLLQEKDRIGLSEDVVDLIMLRLQWESYSHGHQDRTTETPGAVISTAVDPMHLVDPVSYFSFLDDLEREVATSCNLEVQELHKPGGFLLDVRSHTLKDCRSDIDGIMKAVLLLEGKVLFNLQFNIIVQDWRRCREKRDLVARVIPISFPSLLKLEGMVGDKMEPTSQIENTANLLKYVEELRKELKALDIDTGEGEPMPQFICRC
jgi:hypothetical protein